jgi:hypothetical protein
VVVSLAELSSRLLRTEPYVELQNDSECMGLFIFNLLLTIWRYPKSTS